MSPLLVKGNKGKGMPTFSFFEDISISLSLCAGPYRLCSHGNVGDFQIILKKNLCKSELKAP